MRDFYAPIYDPLKKFSIWGAHFWGHWNINGLDESTVAEARPFLINIYSSHSGVFCHELGYREDDFEFINTWAILFF